MLSSFTVSVQMLAYEHGAFIKQAIEGVLMQKTKFKYELIIGEDCSTDNTRIICEKYAKQYPDIINLLPSDRNLGMIENGNRTFRACTGKYIAICEGDDYWTHHSKLQKQVEFLEKHNNYSMCFHKAKVIYNDKFKKSRDFPNHSLKADINLTDIIEKKWFIPSSSICFRKNSLELPTWINHIFGVDMAIQLIMATKGEIRYIDKSMSAYRKHSGGISRISKPGNSQLKLVETFSFFNYYTNFEYDNLIKNRIEEIRKSHLKDLLWRILSDKYDNICIFLRNLIPTK